MPGLIDEVFVRIRPLVAGFASETTAGIRGALTDVNAQVAASAKSSVAAAGTEVDANGAVAASYARVGEAAAARVGEIDAVKAAALEQEAAVSAAARVNVAAAAEQARANGLVAASYERIAAAAVPGSEEQRAAQGLLARAATATGAEIRVQAAANVRATMEEIAANRELAASYGAMASAAARGSEEARLAAQLQASTQEKVAAAAGLSTASVRAASGGFLGFGRSARGAEDELGKFGRGAVAGSGLASHLGRSLAFASGGFLAFAGLSGLLKSAISDAAGVQKSAEVIRAGFGGASEAVIGFAENAAAKLGISAGLADSTSARFAILFKNLGIGRGEAAGMTVGFEKLAGSLSAIKGVDPTQVLQSIVLAAAGNTRGLKQLGIAIDSSQMKIAAFKLGLTSSITQALTPAQKAQAIYALSTQHLGQFMQEAKRHAGDLANVQRRLSAEFANAKEALGTALLPIFTKYATELANWLGRMQRTGRLQRDFNDAVRKTKEVVSDVAEAVSVGWKIFQTAAGWIGGTKKAVEALVIAFAVTKIKNFAVAVESGVVRALRKVVASQASVVEAQKQAAAETAAAADSMKASFAGVATSVGEVGGSIDRLAGQLETLRPAAASAVGGLDADLAGAKTSVSTLGESFVAPASQAKAQLASIGVAADEAAVQVKAAFRGASTPLPAAAPGGAVGASATPISVSGAAKARAEVASVAAAAEASGKRTRGAFAAPLDLGSGVSTAKSRLASVGASAEGSARRARRAFAAPLPLGVGRAKADLGSVGAKAGAEAGRVRSAFSRTQIALGSSVTRAKSQLSSIGTAATSSAGRVRSAFSRSPIRIGPEVAKARSELQTIGTTSGTVAGQMKTRIGGAVAAEKTQFVSLGTTTRAVGSEMSASLAGVGVEAGVMGGQIKGSAVEAGAAMSGLRGEVASVGPAAVETAGVTDGAMAAISAAAATTGAVIKTAIASTGFGAIAIAIGIVTTLVMGHFGEIKRFVVAVAEAIAAAWNGMKEIVIGIGKTIAGALVVYMTEPIKLFLEVAAKAAGWIPGLGGKIKDARDAVEGFQKDLGTGLAKRGAAQVEQGFHDIGAKSGQAFSDAMKKGAGDPGSKASARQAGRDLGATVLDGVNQTLGPGATAAVTKSTEALKSAIRSAREAIKRATDALHAAIQSAHQKVAETVRSAKDNLDKIGQDLAKTIDQIQSKIGGAAGAVAGSPQGAAFAKLKKLIESGAPSFEISRAAAGLRTQLEGVGKTQQSSVKTQLANLTAAFDKGSINYKQFQSRLHEIMSKDGITLKEALKAGGPAFAETFKAQVAALRAQARAIQAVPARLRGVGGAGGAADIKIIRPLETIRSENARIAVAAARQRETIRSESAKVAAAAAKQRAEQIKTAQKQAALQEQLNSVLGGVGRGVREGHRAVADAASKRGREAQLRRERLPLPDRDRLSRPAPARPASARPAASAGFARPARAGGGRAAVEAALSRVLRPLNAIRAGQVEIGVGAAIQRRESLRELTRIWVEMGRVGREVSGAEAKLARPTEVLHQDNVKIAARAERQRDALLRASHRTNSEIRSLRRSGGDRLPGFDNYRKGKGSKDARAAARAGARS